MKHHRIEVNESLNVYVPVYETYERPQCEPFVATEISSDDRCKYRARCQCQWRGRHCSIHLEKALADVRDHLNGKPRGAR